MLKWLKQNRPTLLGGKIIRYLNHLGILALLLMMTMLGGSQELDKPTIVNLMVTAEVPLSAPREQVLLAEANLSNIYDTINGRNLVATFFPTRDTTSSRINLLLTRIGIDSKSELAMSGNHSNEKLGTMPYADQNELLRSSKKYAESSIICGKNEIIVKGFMPQSFSQNQNTYKVLDELGIQYDAGFQAGVVYVPGHENSVWPYPVQSHKFYAVPVSTYTVSGENIALHDSYFTNDSMTASQWYDALAGKFDQIQGKDEPLVVSLTTSVSGSGDYLDALQRFIDYAVSKKAKFVTTMQLVDMTKAGVRNVSELPANANESGECLTCDQSNNVVNITVSAENTTQAVASKAETATS
jgi:hypothetical protein